MKGRLNGLLRSNRVKGLLLVAVFLLGTFLCAAIWKRHDKVSYPLAAEQEPLRLNNEGFLEGDFSTYLPLVVVDTKGGAIKAAVQWSQEEGRHISVGDGLTACNITIYHGQSQNSLTDTPAFESRGRIRLRGNSSLGFDKKQYLLKLTDEEGTEVGKDPMGMGEEEEWVLNASFIDKSLMRNYLALSAAGEVMSYTPDMRYCEVLMKEGERYRYQGVYLFMENVKRGKDRVNFLKYDPSRAECGYLIRRDRFEDDGVTLDTYATRNGLSPEYLGVKSPSKFKITPASVAFIEEGVSRIEQVLYAQDPKVFLTYPSYIDVPSFVDYFIFNEFFANYDAGYHSTYFYKDLGGKLYAGPVWDFDRAMNNDHLNPLKVDSTAFHSAPWFDQLLRDPMFVKQVVKRYAHLRRGGLSDREIARRIDETAKFLGPAQQRDWERWGYFYTTTYLESEDGIDRNAYTYQAELTRMKVMLSEHGKWLDAHMNSLYQFSDELVDIQEKQIPDYTVGNALAVVFIGIFLIFTVLVRRS